MATVTMQMCFWVVCSEALLDGRMPIRADLAKNAIDSLSAQLNLSLEDTALGIAFKLLAQ